MFLLGAWKKQRSNNADHFLAMQCFLLIVVNVSMHFSIYSTIYVHVCDVRNKN